MGGGGVAHWPIGGRWNLDGRQGEAARGVSFKHGSNTQPEVALSMHVLTASAMRGWIAAVSFFFFFFTM